MADDLLSFLRKHFDRIEEQFTDLGRRLDVLGRRLGHLRVSFDREIESAVRVEDQVRELAERVEALDRRGEQTPR